MKRIPLGSIFLSIGIFALLVSIAELGSYFLLASMAKERQNYEIVRNFTDKPALFREDTIAGRKVWRSDYFPTRYYEDEADLRGSVISKEKTPKVYRVFVFGGSSTAGSPFGHWASFSRIVGDSLQRIANPGVSVEVVNFGVSGYGSSRAVDLVQDSLSYQPDLIIIYSGHNEHCDNYALQAILSPQENISPKTKERISAMLSEHSYLFRFIQQLLQEQTKIEAPAEPFTAQACYSKQEKFPLNQRAREAFTHIYASNMTRIIESARAVDVKVVLVSQFSNLFIPPFIYKTRDSIAEKESLLASEFLQNNLVAIRIAISELRQADPSNATASYYEGLLALQSGNIDVAREKLYSAIENDKMAQRFRPSYRRVLEDLNDTASGVYYVDSIEVAERSVGDKLVDGRLVIDVMHPTVTGQAVIAEAVLEQYFSRFRPRPKLFHYEAFDPRDLWRHILEFDRYTVVCKRYYGGLSWDDCLKRMRNEFTNAKTLTDIHQRNRVWEALFVAGIRDRSNKLCKESEQIFRSPWKLLPAS